MWHSDELVFAFCDGDLTYDFQYQSFHPRSTWSLHPAEPDGDGTNDPFASN
jgi:hypothetical protein